MTARSALRATLFGIAATLALAPAVLADTCCANVPVGLDPPSAMPGDSVRLTGLQCLRSDGTGPLPLDLGSFWLWTGERPAEVDPDTVPGPGLPGDLPPTEEWLPFDSVPDATTTSGDATITVPDLPDGTYQLWWWCDGSGPGGGIHYSTGPRLAVGVPPDTATEVADSSAPSSPPGWPVALVFALAAAGFVATLRRASQAAADAGDA